jgi:hypothetical protein
MPHLDIRLLTKFRPFSVIKKIANNAKTAESGPNSPQSEKITARILAVIVVKTAQKITAKITATLGDQRASVQLE